MPTARKKKKSVSFEMQKLQEMQGNKSKIDFLLLNLQLHREQLDLFHVRLFVLHFYRLRSPFMFVFLRFSLSILVLSISSDRELDLHCEWQKKQAFIVSSAVKRPINSLHSLLIFLFIAEYSFVLGLCFATTHGKMKS